MQIKEAVWSGNWQMRIQRYAELAKSIVEANRAAAQKGKCSDI